MAHPAAPARAARAGAPPCRPPARCAPRCARFLARCARWRSLRHRCRRSPAFPRRPKLQCPLSPRACSGPQPLAVGVVEHGTRDLDLEVVAQQRIVRPDALADALLAAAQKAEPDPVAERRRESRRADEALIVLEARLCADAQEMG